MSKTVLNQIKQYFQFQHLLRQGNKVLSNNASLQNWTSKITMAYQSGTSLDEYEKDINSLKNLQATSQSENQQDVSYNFSSGKSIAEQFEYNKTYSQLVNEAEDLFDTSSDYSNWKYQLKTSYNSKQPLDNFDYSLQMFDALQKAETSPIYQSEVDSLIQDNSQFDEFATIADNIGNDYSTPSFSVSENFNNALENSNTGNDIPLFSDNMPELDYDVEMPQTNKSVLEIKDGTIINTEALWSGDGLRDVSHLTTLEEQANKENMFTKLVLNCKTQNEIDDVLEAFQPETLPNPSGEDFTLGNEELGIERKPDYDETLVGNISTTLDLTPTDLETSTIDNSQQNEQIDFTLKMMRLEITDTMVQ